MTSQISHHFPTATIELMYLIKCKLNTCKGVSASNLQNNVYQKRVDGLE